MSITRKTLHTGDRHAIDFDRKRIWRADRRGRLRCCRGGLGFFKNQRLSGTADGGHEEDGGRRAHARVVLEWNALRRPPKRCGQCPYSFPILKDKIAGTGATVWRWEEGVFVRFDVNARGLPWWATFRAGRGQARTEVGELMKSACSS